MIGIGGVGRNRCPMGRGWGLLAHQGGKIAYLVHMSERVSVSRRLIHHIDELLAVTVAPQVLEKDRERALVHVR
jgi:hypothetical protein